MAHRLDKKKILLSYQCYHVIYFIQSDSPTGSRLNSLGWYLLISLLFVFGTVLEFIAVLILKQLVDWGIIKRSSQISQCAIKENVPNEGKEWKRIQYDVEIVKDTSHTSGGVSSSSKSSYRPNMAYAEFFKTLSVTAKIDSVSFVVFTVLFSAFNCIYFIYV